MKLSEIKRLLETSDTVNFILPAGTLVPEHFHVTEIGLVTKNFIDCGGTVRMEKVANFQLWDANDFDHRLKPRKLLNIIALSEKVLGMEDLDIEVEYQSDTIGKYALQHDGKMFVLAPKQTTCLASDHCGTSTATQKFETADNLVAKNAVCKPGTACCQ